MSSDNNSDSCTNKVISKYFTCKSGMDESLIDFKEKKTIVTGPKAIQKPSVSKNKLKKNPKRLKGQKDIRSALKKNELISYSKDFDTICKKSGIDVDSEQLQLAIALSKSLQTDSKSDSDSQSSELLTVQDQRAKIRTTLLEYGFRVPDIKINVTNKRSKKYRNKYKLILTSDNGKMQIISLRYTQIILKNLNDYKTFDTIDPGDVSKINLYGKATNIRYAMMRNDDVFYVKDLLEKSSKSIGSLLRDWSQIPGRPVSPTREMTHIDFSEIECSQDELDIVLSGTIKSTKEIIENKLKSLTKNKILDKEVICFEDCNSAKSNFGHKSDCIETMTREQNVTQARSQSPDIFEDESYLDVSKDKHKPLSQELRNVTVNTNVYMDLTECVGKLSKTLSQNEKVSQCSQSNNFTKRKTNDFMEITDCVPCSQPITTVIDKIDLTQITNEDKLLEENNSTAVKDEKFVENTETMDLTQSSDENTLPFVYLSGKDQGFEDTVMIDDVKLDREKDILKHADLSEESKSPLKNIEKSTSSIESSVEEYMYQNSDKSSSKDDYKTISHDDIIKDNNNIDLTQSSNSSDEITKCPQRSYDGNNLGKNGDVSIDYDDIHDFEGSIHDKNLPYDVAGNDELNDNTIASSQQSEVFEISDDEFNYSVQKSKQENFNFGGSSIFDNLSDMSKIKKSMSDSFLPQIELKPKAIEQNTDEFTSRMKKEGICVETPTNSKYIIKTDEITPMLDYTSMTTPERNKELDRYGLKPFKRKRAIQLLTHLYNQTHPVIETCSEEDLLSPSKKLKRISQQSPKKPAKSPTSPIKVGSPRDKENDLYKMTTEVPSIRDLDCDSEDWIFPRREKAKVSTCAVPLHVSLHNALSCRRAAREAALRYEPLDLRALHRALAAHGHSYAPHDLLKFMDKKCITVKTSDHTKNRRHY